MSSLGWIVLVREHGSGERWHDCGEGPWGTYEAAEAFADAEVGADYAIAELAIFPIHGATGTRVKYKEGEDT